MNARIELPNDVRSVAKARRFVREHLETDCWADMAEVVTLLTSELVTNAVRHAGTPCSVELAARDGSVRVEVGDGNPAPVEHRQVSPGAESGRGIELVDCLSAHWGWSPRPEGKAVWFDVSVPGAAPPA